MDLLEKFKNEKENKTYRRIDAIHNLDWYVGYNEFDEMSLVLVIEGDMIKFSSTKFIRVELEKRVDNKFSLSFNLCDDSLVNIFIKFCEDIIEYTRDLKENDNVLKIILLRWDSWKSAFKNMYNKLLNENEIRGLIGELVFLKEYMIPNYGIDRAIKSWQGPLQYHKDFEIDDKWYEVKTVTDNALTVKISSIQQLENENDKYGELDIVTLKKTNSENKNYITIEKAIKFIEKEINDIELSKQFLDKISSVGYVYDEEYEKYIYEIVKHERYNASNDVFPKIKAKDLKDGISNVSYEILINKIQEFLIKE